MNWNGMRASLGLVCQAIGKVARDDPRRVIHTFKVGLYLVLVLVLYVLPPTFQLLGDSAALAVVNVFAVLEYKAGAALCKCLNTALGTVIAVLFAFPMDYIANRTDSQLRHVFMLGAIIFGIASVSSYIKFIPGVKKNYDHGVVIFILTFCFVSMSSFRHTSAIGLARKRLFANLIGCGICLLTLLIFPKWSGEELHNSTVKNLEGLSKSIEACATQYFDDAAKEDEEVLSNDDAISSGYKDALDSKAQDEMVLNASWEPRHSREPKFPWKHYAKIGAAVSHFGYIVATLHGCLQRQRKTPTGVGCRDLLKEPCIQVANQISKALMEVADSLRNKRHCSPLSGNLHNLHAALQELNRTLKPPAVAFDPAALAFPYFLIESAAGLHKIIEELARVAYFKENECLTVTVRVDVVAPDVHEDGDEVRDGDVGIGDRENYDEVVDE